MKNNCLTCTSEFEIKDCRQKFCGKSCAAKFNNPNRRKRRKITYCLSCQKEIKKRGKKFCSNKCQSSKVSETLVNQWLNGEIVGYSGRLFQIRNFVRKHIISKSDNKCQKCGWDAINKYTNKIPLEIHHIDGDASNCVIANLECLCPNCHSLTHNFRNSGNRSSKRKRSTLLN
jgi:predicted HNH restriction endonuclease